MKKLFLLPLSILLLFITGNVNSQVISNDAFYFSNTSGDLSMRRYSAGDLVWKPALVPTATTLFMNYSGVFSDGVRINGSKFIVDGNIGVGSTNPLAKLTINGDVSSYGTNARIGFNTHDKFNINGSDIAHYGMSLQSVNSQPWVAHSGYFGQLFYTVGSERMRIQSNGDVGIGTTDTKGFKLGVDGRIAALEVKVAAYNNWPDFVFENVYSLPTLKEVEKHIKDNGHLKDIPNAEEVKKDGFYLAEMNAKLLQKIEELTLYTIEQEKRIEFLEVEKLEEFNALKKENEKLNKKFEALEALVAQTIENTKTNR